MIKEEGRNDKLIKKNVPTNKNNFSSVRDLLIVKMS